MTNFLKDVARTTAVAGGAIVIIKGITAGADALANWYTAKRSASMAKASAKVRSDVHTAKRSASRVKASTKVRSDVHSAERIA
jgi:hypothetical protein